jgi:hypothetical protein
MRVIKDFISSRLKIGRAAQTFRMSLPKPGRTNSPNRMISKEIAIENAASRRQTQTGERKPLRSHATSKVCSLSGGTHPSDGLLWSRFVVTTNINP